MFDFRLQFSGQVPTNLDACRENAELLERIGKEIVDMLRHHGFSVMDANLNGVGNADLTGGTPKPQVQTNAPVEDVTRNERIKTKAPTK